MRVFIEEHQPVGLDIGLCRECRDRLGEQTIRNLRALERFDEGARFLEDFRTRPAPSPGFNL